MNAITPIRDFSPVSAGEIMEAVLIKGDLSRLTQEERARYYTTICNSIGINPLTKPFEYIVLNGKLTLYALKACTDQLRKKHGVSVTVVSQNLDGDYYSVHVKAKDASGREDEDFGVVYLPPATKGEARANLFLKAVTKAKRRATLSICGLGFLDETEVEDIPAGAKREVQETIAQVPLQGEAILAPEPVQSQPTEAAEQPESHNPAPQAPVDDAAERAPATASARKPRRGRKEDREINRRYEDLIAADQPRRAFDRAAAPDPEAERAVIEAEERAAEFLRLEHEISSIPSIAALERWYGHNHEAIAKFSEGDHKNALRAAYANKRASLQPHSISQKAMTARGPRYAQQPPGRFGLFNPPEPPPHDAYPDDRMPDIPGYLRRYPEAAE